MATGKEEAQAERLATNEANQKHQDEWAGGSATERLPEFAGRTDEEREDSEEESDERREAVDADVPDSDPGSAKKGEKAAKENKSGTTGVAALKKK